MIASDLHASPWNYPGLPTQRPGLLTRTAFVPMESVPADLGSSTVGGRRLEDQLAALNSSPLRMRHPVVLTGVNAEPDRLREKLRTAHVSPVVPMFMGTLDGYALTHGAGISRDGYVPAALRRAPGERLGVVVGFLDRSQLAALAATMPQLVLREATGGLGVHGTPWPGRFGVFDGSTGVIAVDGRPLPFGTQAEVFAAFPPQVRDLLAQRTGLDPHRVTIPRLLMPRLQDDPTLRFETRMLLGEVGATVPSGLGDLPPSPLVPQEKVAVPAR